MKSLRTYALIIIVAILFTIFVFATIDAFYPKPNYNDYCTIQPPPKMQNCTIPEVPQEAYDACNGRIDYRYENGCPTTYYCNTCDNDYQEAEEKHDIALFYLSALLGILAIIFGLKKKEWYGTAFLIGGALVITIGTAQGYNALGRFIKPLVILIELGLVIFIAQKKL